MKQQTSTVLIVVLIMFQLYSFVKIHALQSSIDNANNMIDAGMHQLDNQIASIYRNVEQTLDEQASLIHSSWVKVGSVDVTMLTVPVTFTVEPKTITDTMEVFLDFNGEMLPLEQTGLEYSVTKDFELSKEGIFPTIVIEDKGAKNVEDHFGLRLLNIKEHVFPDMFARFLGETGYDSKEFRVKGALHIVCEMVQETKPFTELRYVAKVDDKIIKETPIDLEEVNFFGETIIVDVNDAFSVNEGEIFTLNMVAVDNLGFTHEYLVAHYVAGSRMQREPYFEQEKIIAPNGEIIYEFDENNDKEFSEWEG